jgi:hypothetical protein
LAAQVNRLQNNAHWQEMLPPRLKPALILDVVRGAEAPLFRVTARHGGAPLSFHDVGLWIGVDKKLAPFRETVKI